MFFIENRLVNKPEEGMSSHHMHINAHTSKWLVGMCLSLVWHIPLFFWSQNPEIHFSVASLHTVFFYLMPTTPPGWAAWNASLEQLIGQRLYMQSTHQAKDMG